MAWFRHIQHLGKRLPLTRLKRLTAVGSNKKQRKQKKQYWLLKERQQRLALPPSSKQQSDKLPLSRQSDKPPLSGQSEKPQSVKLRRVRQQLSVTWRSAGLPSKQLLHARPNESVALQHCSELSSSSALRQWNRQSVSAVLQK